jgi:hypothetical protein
MRSILLFSALLFVFFSCKQKEDNIPKQQIESNLKNYLSEQVKAKQLEIKVDSVAFMRQDTITEKLKVYKKIVALEKEYDSLYLEYTREKTNALINFKTSVGPGMSKRAMKKNLADTKKMSDSASYWISKLETKRSEINMLDSLAARTDSTNIIAYSVVYWFQVTMKDGSKFKNMGSAIMDKNYAVINYENFYKQ